MLACSSQFHILRSLGLPPQLAVLPPLPAVLCAGAYAYMQLSSGSNSSSGELAEVKRKLELALERLRRAEMAGPKRAKQAAAQRKLVKQLEARQKVGAHQQQHDLVLRLIGGCRLGWLGCCALCSDWLKPAWFGVLLYERGDGCCLVCCAALLVLHGLTLCRPHSYSQAKQLLAVCAHTGLAA